MSRRSIVGTGLLAVAGVLYATGSAQHEDSLPIPSAAQAIVATDRGLPPTSAQPTAPSATRIAAASSPPSSRPATPPSAPRMINGPAADRPRPVPAEGPKNGDVPPTEAAVSAAPVAVAADQMKSADPKVTTERPVTTARIEPTPQPTERAATNIRPRPPRTISTVERREPKRIREQVVMSADASPAPRNNPAPRVQW